MIATRARMNLQHQSVVETHARHLGEHLTAEPLGIAQRMSTTDDAVEQRFGFPVAEIFRVRGRMTVIGRRRSHGSEELHGDCDARRDSPCQFNASSPEISENALQIVDKSDAVRIHDRIGTIGGNDTTLPAALADRQVMTQIVEWRFCRRQRLDIEAIEQRTWTEIVLFQLGRDDCRKRHRHCAGSAAPRHRTHSPAPSRTTYGSAYRGTGGNAAQTTTRSAGHHARSHHYRRRATPNSSSFTPWL